MDHFLLDRVLQTYCQSFVKHLLFQLFMKYGGGFQLKIGSEARSGLNLMSDPAEMDTQGKLC
jgi:hypothetical protein